MPKTGKVLPGFLVLSPSYLFQKLGKHNQQEPTLYIWQQLADLSGARIILDVMNTMWRHGGPRNVGKLTTIKE